jgi:hypothetical protein
MIEHDMEFESPVEVTLRFRPYSGPDKELPYAELGYQLAQAVREIEVDGTTLVLEEIRQHGNVVTLKNYSY